MLNMIERPRSFRNRSPGPRAGRRALSFLAALAIVSALSLPREAAADYESMSFTFDQSNVYTDNVAYGSITAEAYYLSDGSYDSAHNLASGQVRFTVSANLLASYGNVQNLGVSQFLFNTDLNPPPTNIIVTNQSGQVLSGWNVSVNNYAPGYGIFDIADTHSIIGRQTTPVIFTLSDLGANATLSHFLFGSTGLLGFPPAQGSMVFAARVTGSYSSLPLLNHSMGVSTSALAPEPATWLLGLALVVPIGMVRLRRALRTSGPRQAAT